MVVERFHGGPPKDVYGEKLVAGGWMDERAVNMLVRLSERKVPTALHYHRENSGGGQKC